MIIFAFVRRLYIILLYLSIPLLIGRLLWKSRRLPAYRKRMLERFWPMAGLSKVDVWLHAVSLGEVVAAYPVIEALLNQNRRIIVTTMTPTGAERVTARFGDRVLHQYLPYDLPLVLRRFFKVLKPDVGIIMETELWPNVIGEAYKSGLPLYLANARLSDQAFKRYLKMRFFFKPLLQQLTGIFAQSARDAARYQTLGAAYDQVSVPGNIKFDLSVSTVNTEVFVQLKAQWGAERPVVIAASTHEDEEAQWLKGLPTLQSSIPSVLLLIAPRHPERFSAVYELSCTLKWRTQRRSQSVEIDETAQVIVLDSLGELMGFYQVSDYAFVGGSLVPVGGHNVLEPIAMQVPVFTGPYMQNSQSICQDLLKRNAMQMASNADDLIQRIGALHHNHQQREAQVAHASAVLADNRGAVNRIVGKIEKHLRDHY